MRRTIISFILSLLICVGWGQTYNYRYWIDDDIGNAVSGSATGEKQLDVSIASLGNGFHALHIQAYAGGKWSSVCTRYFLKEEKIETTTARYWIDNDMSTLHNRVATNGLIDIDISKLEVGLHAIHYQTMGADGTPSTVRTRYFLVDRVQKGTLTADIRIDTGETTNFSLSDEDIVIDISELEEGEHTLYVTLLDANGRIIEEKVTKFKNIPAINTLCTTDLTTVAGAKAVLSVELSNEDEVKLCQFDLRLPAGVTVATKSDGKLDASLMERAENHSVSCNDLINGDYRFVISSMSNDSFEGNSGTLMEITLDIPATMKAGDYIVQLLNAELSIPDGTSLRLEKPADSESKLTLKDYLPGDANNDGFVTVTDVGCAINYILEKVPEVFIFEAADMNGDKSVSVTDVGLIINYILTEETSLSPRRADKNDEYICPSLYLQRTADGYALTLENKDSFIGFQFDINLADGATIYDMQLQSGNDHLLTYRRLNNGLYRVLCYSLTNSTFTDNEDALLNMSVMGGMTITNVCLTTIGLTELKLVVPDGILTDIAGVNQGLQVKVLGHTLQITSDRDITLQLHSLDGSVCRILHVRRGVNSFEGLRAGVYMIGHRKVILR